MADTTTSVEADQLQNLYGYDAMRAFTQKGQFWRSADTPEEYGGNGHIVEAQTGSGGDTGSGKAVVFDIWDAGTVSTTALGENTDGTATSLSVTPAPITLVEQGDYVHTTRKLRATSYGKTEMQAAWMMGNLAVRTMDTLARDALDAQTGATWVGYGSGGSADATSVATITKGNIIEAANVRKAWAKLSALNVDTMDGGYFMCYIHSHVLQDLQSETGDASWTVKESYLGTSDQPIKDEAGAFAGFRFIVTSNAKLQLKAGNGTTTSAASADVYTTYFLGKEALGFGWSNTTGPDPIQIIVGQPEASGGNDVYGRMQTVAWYALAGFGAIKADSLFKVYSSSTLGANGA